MEGECYLVLDDGKEVLMKKGDVCVSEKDKLVRASKVDKDLPSIGTKRHHSRLEKHIRHLGTHILHSVGCRPRYD